MIQTMDPADEDKFDFDPLDDTKTWPEDIFPLQPVGRMVLNKNPDNFFNENEQVAYCPALIVPGKPSCIELGLFPRHFHVYLVSSNFCAVVSKSLQSSST